MKTRKEKIKSAISTIFIIIVLIITYQIYQRYNFNKFMKAEYNLGVSKFQRDSKVKCIEHDSYKLINTDFNDAMFCQSIDVIPNTPYKVTCKIKTEGVKSKKANTDAGAHICIAESLEKSDNVAGTTDWTEVEFYFNSKNRTKLDIGFRLGGFEDNCIRNSMVFRL